MTPATEATVDLILSEEDHLRRLARRFARCAADVDDLVQDTLLRAYRARHRFEPGTSIRAWTSTILRRVFLTGAIRTKRRALHLDTDVDDAIHDVPTRTTVDPTATAKRIEDLSDEFDENMKRALDRVPELYREPFFLQVFKELSCAEISTRLGVPEGTVMSRIHRARLRLRAELAEAERRAALAERPRSLRTVRRFLSRTERRVAVA